MTDANDARPATRPVKNFIFDFSAGYPKHTMMISGYGSQSIILGRAQARFISAPCILASLVGSCPLTSLSPSGRVETISAVCERL